MELIAHFADRDATTQSLAEPAANSLRFALFEPCSIVRTPSRAAAPGSSVKYANVRAQVMRMAGLGRKLRLVARSRAAAYSLAVIEPAPAKWSYRPVPASRRRRPDFYEADIPDRPDRSWSADTIPVLGRVGARVPARVVGDVNNEMPNGLKPTICPLRLPQPSYAGRPC